MQVGINAAQGGNRIGDIGHAIENFVHPHRYGIVEVLSGHGVGRAIHEDPYIPNFGKAGYWCKTCARDGYRDRADDKQWDKKCELDEDDWTFRTADGKKARILNTRF